MRTGSSKKGIQPPQLPKMPAIETLPTVQLVDNEAYTNLVLANFDLSEQIADDVLFEHVHFRRIGMARTKLTTSQMIDIRLDVCDLTGAEWEKIHTTRIEIVGSRIMGAKMIEAEISDALFKDCSGEYAMFWSTIFKSARFEHCMLQESSFQDADLSGVVFRDCDLTGADMRGAKLVGTDFRGSKVDKLKVGVKELQGAIIDPTQATNVVTLLGITVKWDKDEP